MLVLSKYDVNETADGVEIVGEKSSYVGLIQTVSSYTYSRKYPILVDRLRAEIIDKLLKDFTQMF